MTSGVPSPQTTNHKNLSLTWSIWGVLSLSEMEGLHYAYRQRFFPNQTFFLSTVCNQ
jgi:hypothetical protein